ncbi:MBL fold metallo-hydrolase [Archaeoglobus neptunius]|uniref:MBL fold metallo-hydrolase n=1 Tax=Archaeoglobus neptunius TaxID=2798580 RepID=UPI00192772C9|nr:MBL fold metallo-hydrolase [Archaeoglobus neptunius]
MIVTLLGTGDSPGTPVLNCHCRTCEDARKRGWERKRFSVMVQNSGKTVLIDTSPDLRRQLLDNGVEKVDAVIWTHCHFDHFGGFGEFYRVQNNVRVYSTPQIHEDIGRFMRFLTYKTIEVEPYTPFTIGGMDFTIFTVNHPPVSAVGVKIEWQGYKVVVSGDTNVHIPEESMKEMQNPDLLVVEALAPTGRFKKHMNAREALSLAKRVNAEKVVLTHLGHFYPPHHVAAKNYPVGEDYQSFSFGEGRLDEFFGD